MFVILKYKLCLETCFAHFNFCLMLKKIYNNYLAPFQYKLKLNIKMSAFLNLS